MQVASDEELVAHSRIEGLDPRRRDEIVNELLARYHTRVALWCYRSTGDRESAADLAQEILLKAWRNLDSWRWEAKFSTWMYTIARNHCRNAMAARAVRPEGASEVIEFELADRQPRHDEQFERETEIARMRHLMNTVLDETESRVMSLHYGEEMTLDAITRLLSLTNASGAKAFIVSARRKLKAAVSRLNPATGGAL